MPDDQPLWERQPWDTPASFARFHEHYLLQQDRPRSVNSAYRAYYAARYGLPTGAERVLEKRAPGCWQRWARGQDGKGQRIEVDGQPVPTWADRAAAYDDHLAELDRAKWEARRAEVREQDWDYGKKLRGLADQILEQAPLFDGKTRVIKGQSGQPDQVVKTVKLQGHLAVQALKLASELQRLAAGMPTEIAEHTVYTPLNADELARRREVAQQRAQKYEDELLNGSDSDADGDGSGDAD